MTDDLQNLLFGYHKLSSFPLCEVDLICMLIFLFSTHEFFKYRKISALVSTYETMIINYSTSTYTHLPQLYP